MQSPRCETQQIYKETSLSLRLNNLSAQHVILKTHIVRCLTNRTRLLKHFSPLDSFSKLKIGMLFSMKILFELGAKNEAWDFFSKYDQIRKKLRIWSHLLKKSLMKNLIFCVVSSIPAGPNFQQALRMYVYSKAVTQRYFVGILQKLAKITRK